MFWNQELTMYSPNPKLNLSKKVLKNNLEPLPSLSLSSPAKDTIDTSTYQKFLIRKLNKPTKPSRDIPLNTFYVHEGNNHLLVKSVF